MKMKTLLSAAILAVFGLGACAENGEGSLDQTPAEEADLVPQSRGGKDDTGYLSDLAAELEGVFTSTLHIDVTELDADARQARLEELKGDTSSLRRMADEQIKFARNQINTTSLHINLSTSNFILVDAQLDEEKGQIVVTYTSSVETIVGKEKLRDAGTSLEEILATVHQATLPATPGLMADRVGGACLQDGETAQAYNYFYYFDPAKAGCLEAMQSAGVAPVTATLEIHELTPSKTVYPEYDRLVEDGRLDIVAFFGAAEYSWEVGKWDWGTYQRDLFRRDMMNRGFRLVDATEGEMYERQAGDLLQRLHIIGPETLKDLKADANGLFRRLVAQNEVIFYNGHSFYGSLGVLDDPAIYPEGKYQVFFMNSCWSYEYYTKQIFRHKATAEDPMGWALADVVNDTESGWFHNMAAMSRILLTNLMRGAEAGGLDRDGRYYTWDRIVGAMNQAAIEEYQNRGTKTHEIYGVSGVRDNAFDPGHRD